ncbi:hypothetical protein RB195_007677 [Necator americanus]|uniref:Kinesin motor domain-containing protein n=1 Tax=Necator americanus TaxID=51031 RepID=A0ABR1BYD2_NECAM
MCLRAEINIESVVGKHRKRDRLNDNSFRIFDKAPSVKYTDISRFGFPFGVVDVSLTQERSTQRLGGSTGTQVSTQIPSSMNKACLIDLIDLEKMKILDGPGRCRAQMIAQLTRWLAEANRCVTSVCFSSIVADKTGRSFPTPEGFVALGSGEEEKEEEAEKEEDEEEEEGRRIVQRKISGLLDNTRTV